jgi:hypothetical protein
VRHGVAAGLTGHGNRRPATACPCGDPPAVAAYFLVILTETDVDEAAYDEVPRWRTSSFWVPGFSKIGSRTVATPSWTVPDAIWMPFANTATGPS